MTVNLGEGPADTSQLDNGGQTPVAEPTINPAWSPLLEQLPTSLHGMVTPHLKEWDQNYQQGLQKVHSEYESWKPFQEAGLEPDALYQGYQIQQALEADPQKFIEAVMEHYGVQFPQQGQQPEEVIGEEEPGLYDIAQDPEFQRYGQMTEKMAELLIAQQQEAADAQSDAELDADLADARKNLGEFDEDYVLQRILYYQEDVPTAVQSYKAHVEGIISQHRNPAAQAPVIMGSGGGTPAQNTVVNNMSAQDRRALIAQTLAAAAANGG